jgi:hypothetical protein
MWAAFRIDALIGEPESLNGTPTKQMLFHNLFGVCWLDVSVPDGFRIDDYRWAVLALVEATCLVDAYLAG